MEEGRTLNPRRQRKAIYVAKLEKLLTEYSNILLISVDFVGSKQMQDVRSAIRGRGQILMGKNTIIRKVVRDLAEKDSKLEALLPLIKGNMGFVFTNEDLNEIRKVVTSYKLPAAAKAGIVAPVGVTVPAGGTGLDPGQTSFFQTLNIATKISRGAIEIVSDVVLCRAGEKVTTSAVALLSKLGIKPFEFGIEVTTVYESGAVYDASVLDLEQADLIAMFGNSMAKFTGLCFSLGVQNQATLPHSLGKAFMKIVQLALATDLDFEQMAEIKASMAAGPGTGAATGAATDAAAAPEPEEEEEEEEEAVDMFGGGDDEDY